MVAGSLALKSKQETDMQLSSRDRLDQTIQASRALNWMLYCTHFQGDDLSGNMDGIHTLFSTQTAILEGIANELQAEVEQPAMERNGRVPNFSAEKQRELAQRAITHVMTQTDLQQVEKLSGADMETVIAVLDTFKNVLWEAEPVAPKVKAVRDQLIAAQDNEDLEVAVIAATPPDKATRRQVSQ